MTAAQNSLLPPPATVGQVKLRFLGDAHFRYPRSVGAANLGVSNTISQVAGQSHRMCGSGRVTVVTGWV
jgi:hypothetical protein